ncbi:MAG TPA: cation diffusion facilitator family transporter [Acidimicrobiales bacterium]|jgi:cobalt-zinc-cadmium efflux system protein
MSGEVSSRRARRLGIALLLNVVIVVAQVIFGVVAGSIGLLADAGHNLTDVAALLISLVAVRLARRPPTRARSFGMHRSTILAAQANAAALLAITALLVFESVRRLGNPGHVEGGIVLVVATLSGIANLVAAFILGRSDHDANEPGHAHAHSPAGSDRDLNMRSAFLHTLGDAAASFGVALAGLVILLTGGWDWLDPFVSLVISALIAIQAWKLLRESADVLLESTPAGLDLDSLSDTMSAVEGVEAVHDLHVWTLSSDVRAMSAHVVLDGHPSLEEAQVVSDRVKSTIGGPFRIAHATLELECEACGEPADWCAMDSSAVEVPTASGVTRR